MKQLFILPLILVMLLLACSSPNLETSTLTAVTLPTPAPAQDSPCGDGVCDAVEQANPNRCPADCADTEAELPPTEAAEPSPTEAAAPPMETLPPDPTSIPDPETSTEGDPGATPSVFFAVHIETSDHNTASDSVGEEWPMLAAFVEFANQYGHKLTLEFQPQWAEYALQNADKLAQLREWEGQGHEIAVHHHGVSHAAWDGYTNAPGYQNNFKYRGTMEEAMALLSQLPASGRPLTGGMTDEESDWPSSLIFVTGGQGQSGGGLVSTPSTVTYNGTAVTEVNNRGYQLDRGPTVSLGEIAAALDSASPRQVIGLVAHPYNFWANQSAFEELFTLLQENDFHIQPVSEIIAAP